ncbi:unnamed protein product [Polarella glacialis]|uniref:Serine aminopeptidase S33 domain-containing protein n=1 Tax=Polarella glacialis TaxID=89957 RepID=A0A813JT50_POLGL|nr:unnamed protein product [Polarella glacialis]
MDDSNLDQLWLLLGRSGRLRGKPGTEAELHAGLRVLLGDYSSASAAPLMPGPEFCALLDAIPAAEVKSCAFVPRRVLRSVPLTSSRPDVQLHCGSCQASDGLEIGYVLLVPAPAPPGGGRDGQPPPALLLRFGGNAELASEMARSTELCDLVADGFANVLLVDYRGFGWSDGDASMLSIRRDAEDTFQALTSIFSDCGRQFPAGPVVVMGRSIGALCALHLSVLHIKKVDALVLDSPVACHWPMESIDSSVWQALSSALGPAALAAAGRQLLLCPCCSTAEAKTAQSGRESCCLDPQDLISCLDMPLLMINGTRDIVCPREQAAALFHASPSLSKELLWLPGRGHNEVMACEEYWTALKRFLARLRNHELPRGFKQEP